MWDMEIKSRQMLAGAGMGAFGGFLMTGAAGIGGRVANPSGLLKAAGIVSLGGITAGLITGVTGRADGTHSASSAFGGLAASAAVGATLGGVFHLTTNPRMNIAMGALAGVFGGLFGEIGAITTD